MRIVVNDIAADGGGVLSVLKDFYQYVRDHDRDNEWYFLVCDDFIEPTEHIHVIKLPQIKQSYLKRLQFDLFSGRKFIDALQPDVVFSLQNTITYGTKAPQVVYEHQLLPFQKIKNYSFLKASERRMAMYQHLIGRIIILSVKNASKVIVQTEWMREAVSKTCRIPVSRIAKIAPSVEDLGHFRVDIPRKNNLFFYPTSAAPYKNISSICDAASILEEKGLSFEVRITVPEQKKQNGISWIGQIPREEVMHQFCEAALVFPSYLESFGYPLEEAAQMGAIVLAADLPFAHEVLGDYENAYYFDPFNPQSLAELMEKVISGEIVRKETFRKVESGRSSWAAVVDELLKTAKGDA